MYLYAMVMLWHRVELPITVPSLAPGRIDQPNWPDSYQEPTTVGPKERKGSQGGKESRYFRMFGLVRI